MDCEPESYEYKVQGKTFIVAPVHPQEGGQKISDILLKLMCEDALGNDKENIGKP